MCLMLLLRQHYLDDAFIHLRYAQNLALTGSISYNPPTPNFGVSSLGYTALLSALTFFVPTQALPKIVSCVVFVIIVTSLVILALKNACPVREVLMCALLVICSPFGVRWLTDGMESGLVLLVGASIAFVMTRDEEVGFAAFVIGFAAVLLRIEFLYIVAVACLGRMLQQALQESVAAAASCRTTILLALGAVLAALSIAASMSHLLPDTALAKADSHATFVDLATGMVSAHLASSLFGVGLVLIWIGTFVMALGSRSRRSRPGLLVANASVLLFFALVFARGQSIQGIRYFLFIYAFVCTWNVCVLSLQAQADAASTGRAWFKRNIVVASAAAIFAWGLVDAWLVLRISEGRSRTYRDFVGAHLDRDLARVPGVAWDVGFIGYFSKGHIWDGNGLVNGRSFAAVPYEQRLSEIARQNVRFAFGNAGQLEAFKARYDLAGWRCVLSADFTNTSGAPDTHWLLVAPGTGDTLVHRCDASGADGRP
jgi:hypothetical protein